MKGVRGLRLVAVIVALALLGLVAGGCSSQKEGTGSHSQGQGQPSGGSVTFLTLPSGTGLYSEAVAITNLMTQKTGLKMFMQSVASSLSVPTAVQDGKAQVANSILPIVSWAYSGTKAYDKPHGDLRVLLVGEDMVWSFVSYEGTGVKKMEDLRGKRVGWDFGVVSAFNTEASRKVLEVHGLDPNKDVKSVPQDSLVKPIEDLLDKRIDAGYVSLNGAKLTEFASKVKPVILEITPEKAKEIQKDLPYFFPGVTLGDTEGVPAGLRVISSPVILYANKSLSDDAAYQIVKTVIEQKAELQKMNRVFDQWSYVRPVGLPYHPGAVKYLKEAGLWTQEMEREQSGLNK